MLARPMVLLCLVGLALFASSARADEGMWPLHALPEAALKERHAFVADPALIELLQKSSINFGGASGSFVSADGLVMTNHHVGSGALADLSTPERDLFKTGFLAQSLADELPAPGMQLRVLMSTRDVTDLVNDAVPEGMDPANAGRARREAIATLEKLESEKTGMTARVVTLYNGGQYHLYVSRTFTDVRLVFAPEEAIASFGGDTDNFEFPRFSLDAMFFRIYEDGKPYRPTHWLRVSKDAKAGDLVLVPGHPGRTQRLLTMADLEFLRDVVLPFQLRRLWRSETKLMAFANRGQEEARFVSDDRGGVANGRKALTGQYAGLLDPSIMASKREQEEQLRAKVAANPQWKKEWGDAWEQLERAKIAQRDMFEEYSVLTPRAGTLVRRAMAVVRHATELAKPNDKRLREYTDAALPALYTSLYAEVPINLAYEQYQVEQYLSWVAETLGAQHPTTKLLLDGQSPAGLAALVSQSQAMRDPSGVRAAIEGGKAWLERVGNASEAGTPDPLLALTQRIDQAWRPLHQRFEDDVESVERSAYAKIAAARFAVLGSGAYPDATGTLRLSFGPIVGWSDPEKGSVQPFTTFAGLFERAQLRMGEKQFTLPESWLAAQPKLDASTPFNFVCTADIIGGNSGSPAVNTKGEVIGLIFDGNIHSLPGAFHYDDTMNRAVAVDIRGILAALDKVYGATQLVEEIVGTKQ